MRRALSFRNEYQALIKSFLRTLYCWRWASSDPKILFSRNSAWSVILVPMLRPSTDNSQPMFREFLPRVTAGADKAWWCGQSMRDAVPRGSAIVISWDKQTSPECFALRQENKGRGLAAAGNIRSRMILPFYVSFGQNWPT